jgi:hypothetical protein
MTTHDSGSTSPEKTPELLGLTGARPEQLDDTLAAITRAATHALPDVQEASISILHSGGRLDTVAPTAPVLYELDRLQQDLGEGPCLDASEHGEDVVCPDLRADPRFPRYAKAAAELGFVAQVGLSLFVRPESRGALNLYSQQPGVFTDLADLAPVFAQQTTLALGYALETLNLTRALETRSAIGQAVGIVMERYQLDEKSAFAFLTRISQDRNVKLRDVAAELNASVGPSAG